jgi:hypothetical protein
MSFLAAKAKKETPCFTEDAQCHTVFCIDAALHVYTVERYFVKDN